MNGVALLADRHTVTCFKIAGLKNVFPIENPNEAKKCLLELLEERDLRIILVSESLLNQIQIFEKIVEHQYPIIIPIPDIKGSKTLKTDFVAELIKHKTGIEVKF